MRALFRWLADFANVVEDVLVAKPIPGRPPKLWADQMRWLAKAVRDNTPMQFKFEFGLWTLALLAELILRKFGQKLALASVSRIMRLLGFTVHKPQYQAWQQDPVMVHQWESETYPAIQAQAQATGATIFFVAESCSRSDYHTGTTLAPQGQAPVVAVTGRRFLLNTILAAGPPDEFRFMLRVGGVTAQVFREFLKRLMIDQKAPVYVIVHGHPIHKAKLVRDYAQSLDGRLQLFYLPPYSPQINPDEQVWAHVKRQVSKRLVQSQDEMKRLALGALRRIQRLHQLVKSFFQQAECRYAAI